MGYLVVLRMLHGPRFFCTAIVYHIIVGKHAWHEQARVWCFRGGLEDYRRVDCFCWFMVYAN